MREKYDKVVHVCTDSVLQRKISHFKMNKNKLKNKKVNMWSV